jgi:hypothetical protein
MNIAQSYVSISSFFESWSRFIEIQSRMMEVQDSKLQDEKGFINEKIRFPHEIHNGREIKEKIMLTKGDSK